MVAHYDAVQLDYMHSALGIFFNTYYHVATTKHWLKKLCEP